jgi:hypothetical protein
LNIIVLGCDWITLKAYLESLFPVGMTWENRNLWEIDHIRPLSSFNLENLEEQKIAANYKNLQPLWTSDNRKKSAKW